MTQSTLQVAAATRPCTTQPGQAKLPQWSCFWLAVGLIDLGKVVHRMHGRR